MTISYKNITFHSDHTTRTSVVNVLFNFNPFGHSAQTEFIFFSPVGFTVPFNFTQYEQDNLNFLLYENGTTSEDIG